MKVKTKRSSLIIAILLACVFSIVGLFFVFRSDEKKMLTASAVSSDSTDFYFASGAGIQIDVLELRMRFRLEVKETFFTNGEDRIRCAIVDGADNENIQFYNYGKTIELSESECAFNTFAEGIKTTFIPLSVDMDTSVSIKAEMLDEYGNVRATAYSDARTYDYIHTAQKEATGLKHSTAEEVLSYKESVDKNSLSIHNKCWLDSCNGISFAVNVPQEYVDLVKQESTSTESMYQSSYEITQYYGIMLRYDGIPNLTVGSTFDLMEAYKRGYIVDGINATDMDLLNNGFGCFSTCAFLDGYYALAIIKQVEVYKAHAGTVYQGNHYYGDYRYKETNYTIVDWSNGYCYVNIAERAQEILERTDITLSEEETIWLQNLAGISASTSTIPVYIAYKKLSDPEDPSSIYVDTSEWFEMNSVYAFNPKFVIDQMYSVKDYNHQSDFNVNYYGAYYLKKGNEKVYTYAMETRTILQTKELTYKYDPSTETGKITVVYEDFQYSNFGMRLVNNDPANKLEFMYFPTNERITTNDDYKNVIHYASGAVRLRFRYSTIASHLQNALLWTTQIKAVDIAVSEDLPSGVTVTVGDEYTEVYATNQNLLQYVALQATVTLIEANTPIKVNCDYLDLSVAENGKLIKEEKTTAWKDTTYGEYLSELGTSIIDNAVLWFPEIAEGAECDEVFASPNGDKYMTPVSIRPVEYQIIGEASDYKFTLEVGYNYNTMFQIRITENGVYKRTLYKVTDDVRWEYYGEYFVDMIPTGWRVKTITAGDERIAVLVDDETPDNYKTTKIRLYTEANDSETIPLTVEMTDVWDLAINYLETYKNTPFMVKKRVTKDVRVLDYPDVYKLSKEDLAKILTKEDMKIGIQNTRVDVDKINVTFNGYSMYTADVTYGFRTLRVINYEGEIKEIKIPLTSYTEWKNSIGQSAWSIFMLNTDDNTYFKYSTEASENDLYGFFFVSVFEEQISDFNRLFKNNTSEGQVTVFNQRKVEGSSLYKFFDRLSNKTGLKLFSNLCMAWCEVFNDDNQIVYSYYGYLDGTTENAYMSNGGADNAFDDDTAFENTTQDIGDWFNNAGKDVGDWFKALWDKFRASNWDTVLLVVACSVGGLIIIGLGWKWGKRYYLWLTAPEPKKTTTKKKSTTKKKTTAKGKKK